jgi:hypothetical protein
MRVLDGTEGAKYVEATRAPTIARTEMSVDLFIYK